MNRLEIKQSDRDTLLPLLDRVFEQQHEGVFADRLPEDKEQEIAFGAWAAGRLTGGIVGKRQYDTLHISLLGVEEGHQKSGMGSKLIQAMEAWAVEEDVKTITLSTKAYQALGFYLKHGYEVFGELTDVPMMGTTKYYLAKKINR